MASEMAVWADAPPQRDGRKGLSRPVDLVHLSRYTLGDRALEREVLELFCAQSAIYFERLRAASSDKEWKDAAHSLIGAARAIGAWRTAAAGEDAEALSGEGMAHARASRLRDIDASLEEARAYIGALLADR